jgi:hypothetical protein
LALTIISSQTLVSRNSLRHTFILWIRSARDSALWASP